MNFIGFDNYRIFNKETFLRLKPITILTGPNSSGKSSVIKAAKLLKQNALSVKILDDNSSNASIIKLRRFSGGATRLPEYLEFTPDEYGHLLSNFDSVLSNLNRNKTELSYILPVNTVFTDEILLGKLTFFGYQNQRQTIVSRKSYKVFENSTEVLSLEDCQGDIFFGVYVNFNWMSRILTSVVIPALSKLYSELLIEVDKNPRTIESVNLANLIEKLLMIPEELLSQSNWEKHLPGIVKSERWLEFDLSKPILPFYQMFIFNNTSEKKSFYLSDWYSENAAIYEGLKRSINNEIGFEITDFLDKEKKAVVYKFFKLKESEFFDYINEQKLIFPFQQFNNYDYSNQWEGIILENRVIVNDEDHQFVTPERTKNLLLSFPLFGDLLYLYQSLKNGKLRIFDHVNNEIMQLFIRRLSSYAASYFATKINEFEFYDSTRASQSLFYHQTLTPFEYTLLNHHFHRYGKMDDNGELYHYEYLQRLGICDKFRVEKGELGYYKVSLIKDGIEMPLSDFGSGITKLFFLYLAIQSKLFHTLFIEEPETNLHPDLQSKLADLIVETTRYNYTQVVVETHSEYFIRKLQYLVATQKVESDKILINYFNPAKLREKEGIVKEIIIQNDGSLSEDFGPGFFDEALNWKFELMKLKNMN